VEEELVVPQQVHLLVDKEELMVLIHLLVESHPQVEEELDLLQMQLAHQPK
tara:strand:- start:426 stop:578 length:153 start_codon:yes stop_codon:yes gene_type:complete